jgi:hypothetical protein
MLQCHSLLGDSSNDGTEEVGTGTNRVFYAESQSRQVISARLGLEVGGAPPPCLFII